MPLVAPRLPPADPETENAKQVILDIIAAKGGRFAGKTLLFKAFYLAHLYYWLQAKGILTDYPIVKMPNGPGIDRGDDLLLQLLTEGLITQEYRQNGPYQETVYVLAKPYPVDPTDPRHKAALDAIDWIGERTAAEVCRIIHDFSRSWQRASDGEILPIYLDLLSEEEYQKMKQPDGEIDEILRIALGEGGR